MFEKKHQELLPLMKFFKRVVLCIAFSAVILLAALTVGIVGYHFIAGFAWIDALLNASMILTGMGPVGQLTTNAGKIFASLYALFSGLVFVTIMAVTIAPIMHRLLHLFHIDEDDFNEED